MADKSLGIGLLAVLAGFLLVAFFANGKLAYARCTEEDVKTGNCRFPDDAPPSAIGQNVSPTITAAMLQECKELGISPEKCSENEILKHRCLGAVGAPCGSNSIPSQPELSPSVMQILAGSGIAFVASIFAIRKLRVIRKKRSVESN